MRIAIDMCVRGMFCCRVIFVGSCNCFEVFYARGVEFWLCDFDEAWGGRDLEREKWGGGCAGM